MNPFENQDQPSRPRPDGQDDRNRNPMSRQNTLLILMALSGAILINTFFYVGKQGQVEDIPYSSS